MLPVLAEAGAGWLEEPFPPYQDRSWRAAAALARPVLPLAAGENLYTRYDFQRLVDGGTASIVQPDLSRCGGITEALRIAALASAGGLPVCTHGCHTGLNFAASVHYLAGIENAWYFEADGSTDNPLRTTACSASYTLSEDGTVLPLEGPGLGVDVDRGARLRRRCAHPASADWRCSTAPLTLPGSRGRASTTPRWLTGSCAGGAQYAGPPGCARARVRGGRAGMRGNRRRAVRLFAFSVPTGRDCSPLYGARPCGRSRTQPPRIGRRRPTDLGEHHLLPQ